MGGFTHVGGGNRASACEDGPSIEADGEVASIPTEGFDVPTSRRATTATGSRRTTLVVAATAFGLTFAVMPAMASAATGSSAPLPIVPRSAATSDLSTTGSNVVKGQVLVRWKTGVSTGSRAVVRQNARTGLLKKLSLARTEKVSVPTGSTIEATVKALAADPRVESAQPNFRYRSQTTPEQFEDVLWGLNNIGQDPEPGYSVPGVPDVDINAPEAWAQPSGGGSSSVVVGIIDTGIDISHPDLSGAIWTNPLEASGTPGVDDDGNGYVDDVNGWDFYNGNKSVYDGVTCFDGSNEDFHGTHVAGTIGARRNVGGVVGVAYNVKIMPLKALGCDGGDTASVVEALDYATAKGVKIVNMSLGGSGYDQVFKDAIDASGILVVAAAGNGGEDGIGDNNDSSGVDWPSYPASFTSANVLSVAAINNRGALTEFSNFGATSVDVAAPGESILSDYPGSQLVYLDGTSMATPHVTGVAALVESVDGVLTPTQIKTRILSTVRQLPSLNGMTLTGGLVDAEGAVTGVPTPKAATAMSVSRSSSAITYGQSVSVYTRLTRSGVGVVGRTVKLHRYTSGSWPTVCTATTNSGGYASCVQKPSTNSAYYWEFDGDLGLASSSSTYSVASSNVAVRPVISSALSPSRMVLGRTSTFSGAISPSKKGALVRLQKKVGSKWVTVAKTAITSRNTYAFGIRPGSRGSSTYRVYFYADSYNAAQSTSARTLTVV